MADINHCLSKTLVQQYGEGTVFAIEDLTGGLMTKIFPSKPRMVNNSSAHGRSSSLNSSSAIRARLTGSTVVKVAAEYTSQRCHKCGGIHKEYRHHNTHEYICESCGSYRANDDLTGRETSICSAQCTSAA